MSYFSKIYNLHFSNALAKNPLAKPQNGGGGGNLTNFPKLAKNLNRFPKLAENLKGFSNLKQNLGRFHNLTRFHKFARFLIVPLFALALSIQLHATDLNINTPQTTEQRISTSYNNVNINADITTAVTLYGILIDGATTTIGALNNNATISAGIGIQNWGNAIIGTLNNSGTISGMVSIHNHSTITTLNNSGKITNGIENSNVGTIGTLTNTDTGTIDEIESIGTISTLDNQGEITTLDNHNNIATLSNSGTITTLNNLSTYALGTIADFTNSGTIKTLNNKGTIGGVGSVGFVNNGTITTLDNSGTISGGANAGIANATTGTIESLTNTSTGTIDEIENVGTIGSLNNQGEITTIENRGNIATNLSNKGLITTLSNQSNITKIENFSTISALNNLSTGNIALFDNEGTLNNLNNQGTISLLNNPYGGNIITLDSSNKIDRLNNQGTITTLTNTNTGNITSYFYNNGTVNTLNNQGSINALENLKAGNISNLNNDGGTIATLTNSGAITLLQNSFSSSTITTLTNSGTIATVDNTGTIATLNNLSDGTITRFQNHGDYATIANLNNQGRISMSRDPSYGGIAHIYNIGATATINISNYHLDITKTANDFNAFNGYTGVIDDISHLVINDNYSSAGNGIKLLDSNSKILISIGGDFELNKDYLLSKLIVNNDGSVYDIVYSNNVSVSDLYSHLELLDSTYELQRGSVADSFRIVVKGANQSQGIQANIGSISLKSNISNVNLLSQHIGHNVFKNTYRGASLKNAFSTSSQEQRIQVLALNSINKQVLGNHPVKIQDNQCSLMYHNNTAKNTTELDTSISGENIVIDRINGSCNLANTNESNMQYLHNYHFFFTPFITHSIINANNVSGLSYGFVSGFNAKLGDSHTLGTHIGFSYGNLKGSNTNESIESTNLNALLGLHYKLDLVYKMYVKALIDAVFINNNANYVISNNVNKADSNSLGYNLNIAFGKDFDFESAGIFGVELGLNSLGLNSSDTIIGSQTFKAQFTNLIYADLGINYNINFDNGIGLDSTLGIKYLLNNPTGNIQISNGGIQSYTQSYNLGADKLIAYFGLGVNYQVNSNIELGLNYLGNFGDESIQNSGFFNVKLGW
ncbi:hypothetical protein CCY99_02730 [Helicobacter sp. 16-1353]|uniref:beta strand repeat-containing protein n=1 Tax=Helicobacter sp. 16-1353 TaxID=2004996 RepID=UPI000DCCF5C7|nr:autotransporter outer membrane beta-barrel domain-containing protein [Helicobacter sp. 16-1353]RAX54695.1 hypothetical protein CCY99_02730 [Helicobacter sp. 16-1353]